MFFHIVENLGKNKAKGEFLILLKNYLALIFAFSMFNFFAPHVEGFLVLLPGYIYAHPVAAFLKSNFWVENRGLKNRVELCSGF